ncbi:hypothetical protein INT45_004291 [Circinella minor]|uniref:Grh/CP2 DB domain-containing protein n=1 Tax=Circinella minor TaxID=1195481 RepID=A0A8H7SDX4_9FUNG|nr:hypothetical protein INT45_004291 [Circinella minor]
MTPTTATHHPHQHQQPYNHSPHHIHHIHHTYQPQDQQQPNVSTIGLRPSYVTHMIGGSTIATASSSTDYFKPPADINDKIVKNEIILDSNSNKQQQQQQQQQHHHAQQSGMSWNDSRPGQDPMVNMMIMNDVNSGNSGGYPDDSFVAHYTYYSPSSAIQSSPSSDFSPPLNSFATSSCNYNNSNSSSNNSHSGMASFGRPQHHIKRRCSSALAITPVPEGNTTSTASTSTIADNNQPETIIANSHNTNNTTITTSLSTTVASSAVVDNVATTPMSGHFYSHIPSQPSLDNIHAQHSSQQQQHHVATSGSTSTMVTPTSSATGTPSPCSFPGSASSSSSAGQPIIDQRNANIPLLRFNIILQAATQISEGSPTTYLNRGQSYAIHLQDTYEHDINITSTFIIMFHEPSHRKVALNYWKFWLGQQKNPPDARAVTLDQEQSVGIHNIKFTSFDRITFDWNGRYGAKIFVRFNCLSTDFSRIKGVKGIPLRAQMETMTPMTASSTTSQQLLANNNTFPLSSSSSADSNSYNNEYAEQCYCKIKLFRDKGAERKNKDDAKQIGKHLERVYAEGNPRQHPFWLMYNQPKPYSVFSEVPTTPQASDALFSTTVDDSQPQSGQVQLFQQQMKATSNDISSMTPSPIINRRREQQQQQTSDTLTQTYGDHQQQQPSSLQHKRSYSEIDDYHSRRVFDLSATVPVSSLSLSETSTQLTPTSTNTTTGLSLYVNVKTTQHQRFHSPPSPTATTRSRTDKKKLQYIVLEKVAVQELIAKLCPVLSLHYSQVSEVLWRQPKNVSWDSNNSSSNHHLHHHHQRSNTSASTSKAASSRVNNNDGTLIQVDDEVLASSFPNDTVVAVEWDIKSDGTVRLLLQQQQK